MTLEQFIEQTRKAVAEVLVNTGSVVAHFIGLTEAGTVAYFEIEPTALDQPETKAAICANFREAAAELDLEMYFFVGEAWMVEGLPPPGLRVSEMDTRKEIVVLAGGTADQDILHHYPLLRGPDGKPTGLGEPEIMDFASGTFIGLLR